LAERGESQNSGALVHCTNARNRAGSRRCDPVSVEIARAQLLWTEGGDLKAVRRALLEALRLLDE